MDRINVTRSSMPDFKEYCDEIRELFESHWLTNMGVKHIRLQAALENYLDVKHLTLYTNGHLALEHILSAYNFPKGSEVITTPFTFASTTHAIVRSGLVPVFCDINDEDYTIDTLKIEKLITDKTCAIMPVHVYGNVCDVDKIQAIADRYDLKVIYDAAHAFGVIYNGKGIAAYGDASMFSFHATKVFNTVEGGALCYSDNALISKLDALKNFGLTESGDCEYVGANAKMSEFHAAMGVCNLRHVSAEIAKRALVVERYRQHLSNVDGIKLCKPKKNVVENHAYFPVIFDGKYSRDDIYQKLAEHNIIARKYFYPLTNSFECYKNYPTAGAEKTPIADYIAQRVLCLPLYSDLSIDVVDKICGIILN